MKILIVDDENNKVQSIREIFIREKISVDIEVATGINEAVKKIYEEKRNNSRLCGRFIFCNKK